MWSLCSVKQTHTEYIHKELKPALRVIPQPLVDMAQMKGYGDLRSRHPVSEHKSKQEHTAKGKPMRVAVKAGIVPALWLLDKAHKHSFES